jgi:SecD/SecF fusion protein
MRNKGAIITVSVLLTVICLYYLSFTFVSRRTESKADDYAEARFEAMNLEIDEFEEIHIVDSLTKRYLDSMQNEVVVLSRLLLLSPILLEFKMMLR